MTQDRPLTGIGVMIFRERKILLGKRIGAHGAGEYVFPGGISSIWSHSKSAHVGRREKNVVWRS